MSGYLGVEREEAGLRQILDEWDIAVIVDSGIDDIEGNIKYAP